MGCHATNSAKKASHRLGAWDSSSCKLVGISTFIATYVVREALITSEINNLEVFCIAKTSLFFQYF